MGDSEEAPEQEGAETGVGQVSLDVGSWVGAKVDVSTFGAVLPYLCNKLIPELMLLCLGVDIQ